jgi:cytochrome c oxidase assembly factor CtaG
LSEISAITSVKLFSDNFSRKNNWIILLNCFWIYGLACSNAALISSSTWRIILAIFFFLIGNLLFDQIIAPHHTPKVWYCGKKSTESIQRSTQTAIVLPAPFA